MTLPACLAFERAKFKPASFTTAEQTLPYMVNGTTTFKLRPLILGNASPEVGGGGVRSPSPGVCAGLGLLPSVEENGNGTCDTED